MGNKIKILVIIFILFFVHSTFAIPNMMNYRGKLFENGNPVNGMRNFRFRVYDQPTLGNLKWDSGGPIGLDVNNGYYNFTLNIPTNIFTNNNLYLDVEVNGSSLSPREQLVSAGYSYNADMVDGLHATNLNYWKANNNTNIYHTKGTVGIGGLSLGPEKFHVFGDSALEGDLYLFNRYINDVYALTIQPDDAAQTGLKFGSSGTFLDYTFNDLPGKTLLFQNNNKLGMSINSNGYVGIGLSSPLYRLDISGTNSMTGFKMTPNAANGRVLTSDASGFGTWQNLPTGLSGQGTLGFISRFKSSMEITNSSIFQDTTGRIGIGTTTPQNNTLLHVNYVSGNAHKYGIVSTISNNVTLDRDMVAIAGYANGLASGTYGYPVGVMGIANPVSGYSRGYGVYAGLGQSIPITSAGVECALFANASNYGPAGIFLNGNVGIGTINPQQQLEITGNFRLPSNSSSNAGVIYSGTSKFIHGIGTGNLFFGLNAGNFLLTGTYNIGIGYRSFYNNTVGSYNSGLGSYSGYYFSGDYNTFIGYYSGYGNVAGSTGDYNAAVGYYAGRLLYTGGFNSLFGAYSGNNLSSGSGNTILGYAAGMNITTGNSNVIIGQQAGNSLVAGSRNVLIGYFAGFNETGSGKLYIDNSPTTMPLIWGDFNNDIVNINGNLGVGTNNPTTKLNVIGEIRGEQNTSPYYITARSLMGTGYGGFRISSPGTANYRFTMQNNMERLFIANSGGDRIIIDQNGFVGIGSLNPPPSKFSVYDGGSSVTVDVESDNGEAFVRLDGTTGNVGFQLLGNDTYQGGLVYNIAGDYIRLLSSGSGDLRVYDTSVVINEDSNDVDFRVEGAADANLLMMDAANNKIGVGYATPDAKLHVYYTSGVDTGSYMLRVTKSGSSKFTVYTNGGTAIGSFTTPPVNGLYVSGDVNIGGTLTKGGGTFKIDHPLDPENKYLSHSFVESPDMMNVYNGNIITDNDGNAIVALPSYFSSLNKDFRYQLTVIGIFAQAIISEEINNNQFKIKTDKPNVKVSWQVTGIRKDLFAEKHRIKVEEEKEIKDRGKYLYPELYGKVQNQRIGYQEPEKE